MAYASLERFRDITGRNVLALHKPKKRGKRSWPVLHLFSRWKSPLPRSLRFAVRHEKRFHPGGGNHAPPLPLPADQEQFRFRAPRQLSLSRRLGHRGGGHHLRRQEKDVRTAGRLQGRSYCSSIRQIQDGDAKDYWRAQYAKLAARLEKDFGASITTDDLRDAVR